MAPELEVGRVRRSRHLRRWLSFAGCLLVAVGVAAMALTNREPDPAGVAVYNDETRSGMDALLEGTLSLRDGCVIISAQGAEWTPVFPKGSTKMSGDALVWGGREYPTSSHISLGGGVAAGPAGLTIPVACPRDNLWIVSPL